MFKKKTFNSTITRPINLAILLLLTAGAWGYNWWQQSRSASVVAHIEAGMKYLQQGQGAAAEKEWREAVRLNPHDAQTWELLGNYCLATANWTAARNAFSHVLEIQPQTPQIHYRLAACSAQLNDIPATRLHAEEELKQNPDHVGALDILTTVLARSGEDKLRLGYLRHLVELEPQDDKYVAQLADALIARDDYGQAKPVIEKLLKLKPNFGPAHAMRGVTILYTNPSPRGLALATQEIQKALKQNPEDTAARLYLAKVYLRMGKPRDAIFHLEKLEHLPTAHMSYLFELAKAHQMMGNVKKARELREHYASVVQRSVQIERLKTQLVSNPNDFAATLEIGLLLLGSEKPVGSEEYLKKAAAMRPQDSQAKDALLRLENLYQRHLQIALSAMNRHDYDVVGQHLSQAMMLRPQDVRTTEAVQRFQRASASEVAPVAHSPNHILTPEPSTVR